MTLDMVPCDNGIRTVVWMGVVTQGCVESTARDVGFMHCSVVVGADAVATAERDLYEAALEVLRTRGGVLPLDQVLWVRSGANRRHGCPRRRVSAPLPPGDREAARGADPSVPHLSALGPDVGAGVAPRRPDSSRDAFPRLRLVLLADGNEPFAEALVLAALTAR